MRPDDAAELLAVMARQESSMGMVVYGPNDGRRARLLARSEALRQGSSAVQFLAILTGPDVSRANLCYQALRGLGASPGGHGTLPPSDHSGETDI